MHVELRTETFLYTHASDLNPIEQIVCKGTKDDIPQLKRLLKNAAAICDDIVVCAVLRNQVEMVQLLLATHKHLARAAFEPNNNLIKNVLEYDALVLKLSPGDSLLRIALLLNSLKMVEAVVHVAQLTAEDIHQAVHLEAGWDIVLHLIRVYNGDFKECKKLLFSIVVRVQIESDAADYEPHKISPYAESCFSLALDKKACVDRRMLIDPSCLSMESTSGTDEGIMLWPFIAGMNSVKLMAFLCLYNACDLNQALFYAIRRNNSEMVEFLLSFGIDITATYAPSGIATRLFSHVANKGDSLLHAALHHRKRIEEQGRTSAKQSQFLLHSDKIISMLEKKSSRQALPKRAVKSLPLWEAVDRADVEVTFKLVNEFYTIEELQCIIMHGLTKCLSKSKKYIFGKKHVTEKVHNKLLDYVYCAGMIFCSAEKSLLGRKNERACVFPLLLQCAYALLSMAHNKPTLAEELSNCVAQSMQFLCCQTDDVEGDPLLLYAVMPLLRYQEYTLTKAGNGRYESLRILCFSVIRKLLDKGISPYTRNSEGKTVLQVVQEAGDTKLAALLEKHSVPDLESLLKQLEELDVGSDSEER